MPFTTPYGTLWRLHEAWRAEVLEAEQRYKQHRNETTKAEYRLALKIFSRIVMQDGLPRK